MIKCDKCGGTGEIEEHIPKTEAYRIIEESLRADKAFSYSKIYRIADDLEHNIILHIFVAGAIFKAYGDKFLSTRAWSGIPERITSQYAVSIVVFKGGKD